MTDRLDGLDAETSVVLLVDAQVDGDALGTERLQTAGHGTDVRDLVVLMGRTDREHVLLHVDYSRCLLNGVGRGVHVEVAMTSGSAELVQPFLLAIHKKQDDLLAVLF